MYNKAFEDDVGKRDVECRNKEIDSERWDKEIKYLKNVEEKNI